MLTFLRDLRGGPLDGRKLFEVWDLLLTRLGHVKAAGGSDHALQGVERVLADAGNDKHGRAGLDAERDAEDFFGGLAPMLTKGTASSAVSTMIAASVPAARKKKSVCTSCTLSTAPLSASATLSGSPWSCSKSWSNGIFQRSNAWREVSSDGHASSSGPSSSSRYFDEESSSLPADIQALIAWLRDASSGSTSAQASTDARAAGARIPQVARTPPVATQSAIRNTSAPKRAASVLALSDPSDWMLVFGSGGLDGASVFACSAPPIATATLANPLAIDFSVSAPAPVAFATASRASS